MICPHCKYENGWNDELERVVKGDKGRFYVLPIEMTKRDVWESETIRSDLYACPNCKIAFINIEE